MKGSKLLIIAAIAYFLFFNKSSSAGTVVIEDDGTDSGDAPKGGLSPVSQQTSIPSIIPNPTTN